MKYLRFGEIPQNGKSINFFKMTNQQNEDFTFALKMRDLEEAYENVPDDAYEAGLSVFKIDANGLPEIKNMRLIVSLCARLDEPVYIVTGKEIGLGNDKEPLVLCESVEPVEIEKEKLLKQVLDSLKTGFKNHSFKAEDNFGSNQVFEFLVGEKSEFCFDGWTFSDPVSGFDASTGVAGRR